MSDLNVVVSIVHDLLQPGRHRLNLFLKKLKGTAAKASRICCSSSWNVLGFDR